MEYETTIKVPVCKVAPVKVKVAQSCLTLYPMDSTDHGIL